MLPGGRFGVNANLEVAFWVNNLIGTSYVSKENGHCSNPHSHLLIYQKENEKSLNLRGAGEKLWERSRKFSSGV